MILAVCVGGHLPFTKDETCYLLTALLGHCWLGSSHTTVPTCEVLTLLAVQVQQPEANSCLGASSNPALPVSNSFYTAFI